MLKWNNMEDIKLNAMLGEGAREGGGSLSDFHTTCSDREGHERGWWSPP